MKKSMICLIKAYQYLLSPWVGNSCRFHPSCSNYALQAIEIHGPLKGGFLSLRRVLRCHPWCEGGHDPVPGSDSQDHIHCCNKQKDNDAKRDPQ